MIISALINNITLIIALSILYIFIIRRWKYGSRTSQAISGFLFGSVAVVGMMNPLIISPGLIFDGRSIIISVAGFIGGWVTALIAALMGIIYRTWIGGPGGIMGVSVIASSAAIGIAYHYIRRHKPHVVSPLYLIGFGIIVHICMLALTLTLPSGIRYEVFTNIAIPVILVYPIGTLLVCVVLLDLELRIKAEDALQDSEARYRMLFEHSPDGIVIIDPTTAQPLEFNETAHRQLGYSREEFSALSIFGLEVAETPEETRSRIAHVIREGRADFETRQRTKQSAIRNVHVTAQIIEISGKRVYHCIWRDITERKRSEETLIKSEEKYRLIAENMTDVITIMDKNLRFTYVSPSIMRLRGFTVEEVMEQPLEQVMTPESLRLAYRAYEEEMQLEASGTADPDRFRIIELEEYRKDMSTVWVEVTLSFLRDANGRPTGMLSLTRDIDARRRVEGALRESDEKYRELVKNAPAGIYEVDYETNRFISVNDVICEYTGYTRDELSTMNLFNLLTEESQKLMLARLEKLMAGEKLEPTVEYSIRTKDRNELWGLFSARYIYEEGKLKGSTGVIYDITDRKRAEKELQNALQSLRKSFNATIQVLVSAVETRDPYTAGHQIRSADLARAIATEMGLPQDKIEGISMAGSIHDIGKLSIPAEILSKPTKLTEIEFSLIKEHPRKGYEMLKDVESPWPLAQIVYQHHERIDGSGYPRHLKGEEILIEARILAVSDVVESMASHRPYRPALGIDAALDEIEKNRGIYYDNAVADACLRLFREKGFQLEGTSSPGSPKK